MVRSTTDLIPQTRTRFPLCWMTATAPNLNNCHPGTLIIIHALAQSTTIKLHGNFAATDPGSRQKCIAAAQAIVTLVEDTDPPDVSCCNPFVGVSHTALSVIQCELISR